MNVYSIVLFLHIAGALGIFVALGLEWTGLQQIRRANLPEQVRPWMGIFKGMRKVGFVSMLATVITGAYMMATVWHGAVWIYMTLAALVLIVAIAQVVTAPRMGAMGKALFAEKGPLSSTFHGLANQSLLSISLQTRAAIALGIIFLKIARPGLGGSLLTLGVAIVLGIVSALPFPHLKRAQPSPAK